MLPARMTRRWVWRLACLLLLLLASCHVYEDSLLDASRDGSTGGTEAGASGGDGGGDACVPSTELCNDRDDDCNGVVDDELAANADCSTRYHATVTCGRSGVCLFVANDPKCDPGYYHCDGLPETGCESDQPCCAPMCDDDAGTTGDDAG